MINNSNISQNISWKIIFEDVIFGWVKEEKKQKTNSWQQDWLVTSGSVCTHGLVQDANTLLQKKTVVVRDPFSNAAGWLEEVRNMKRSTEKAFPDTPTSQTYFFISHKMQP